jgi:chromosome partitioning protein
MRTWTVANQKGGVGKTTTVVGLGGILAGWGFRTLLVDMDPHGSLTAYFNCEADASAGRSVYRLFQAAAEKRPAEPRDLLCKTGIRGLELLPAVMALATLDRAAGRLNGMGLVLKGALARFEERFDFVLVDCPPVLGVLMINALAACERLVVPVQTEFLALKGLERMLNTLEMVLRSGRRTLPVTIVPSMFDPRTRASVDSLEALRRDYPERIWRGVIPVDTRLRDASNAGLPPVVFDPRSRGVLAYQDLLEDLFNEDDCRGLSEAQP